MNLFSGGLIFTTLFILTIIYWTLKMFLEIKKSNNGDTETFFYLLIILTIMISGIFDTPYWKNDLAFLFWIVIVLGMTTLKSND